MVKQVKCDRLHPGPIAPIAVLAIEETSDPEPPHRHPRPYLAELPESNLAALIHLRLEPAEILQAINCSVANKSATK